MSKAASLASVVIPMIVPVGKVVVPLEDNVVNAPAAGVVPPIAELSIVTPSMLPSIIVAFKLSIVFVPPKVILSLSKA